MGTLVDEKFKDCSPIETVERIIGILNNLGICVEEEWGEHSVSNCYALSLIMRQTRMRTNGKGKTKELARASAYAEFMERLQSGLLGNAEKQDYSDCKMMDKNQAMLHCKDIFTSTSRIISEFYDTNISAESILDSCFGFNYGKDQIEVIPFYNVTEDTISYVPTDLMMPLYGSTGNSAGNTPEEAIVQGTSEIIERWFQRYFMCKDLVPPTIPEDYLKQFPNSYETITEIRNKGLDVIIKDCSMGTGYPVIATAVINKNNHCYHVHMGASPVFEIALGRSLTETFQGRVISSVADTSLTETAKGNASTFKKGYIHGRGAYPIFFFSENSSFDFVPFEDRSSCNNKELLSYVLNFIRERNMKLYIRDVSHLGFPSYKIIVPEMCSASMEFLTSPLPISALTGKTKSIRRCLKEASDEQLYEMQLLNRHKIEYNFVDRIPKASILMKIPISDNPLIDRAVGYIHVGYVEWSCGDYSVADHYIAALSNLKIAGISDYFSCLRLVRIIQKTNADLVSILSSLSLFYEADVIEMIRKVCTENSNPFAPYVVSCHPEKNSCSICQYKESCRLTHQHAINTKVNEFVKTFNNEKAFLELKKLFKSI